MKWPYYAISTHCVGVWVVLEVMVIWFWVVVGYNLPLSILVSGLFFILILQYFVYCCGLLEKNHECVELNRCFFNVFI